MKIVKQLSLSRKIQIDNIGTLTWHKYIIIQSKRLMKKSLEQAENFLN